MAEWRVLARADGLITLTCDDAVLVIEEHRADVSDPELDGAIYRLAPHLTFGECMRIGTGIERLAHSKGERVVVGRFVRGTTGVAYIVTSREPIEVSAVVDRYLPVVPGPFDHVAD